MADEVQISEPTSVEIEVDVKAFRSSLKLNVTLGKYSKALIGSFKFIQSVVTSKLRNKEELLKECKDAIIKNASKIMELRDNIEKQDLLTTISRLGISFTSHKMHLLAENAFVSAIKLHEHSSVDQCSSSQRLTLAELIFELSMSQRAQNKWDESVTNLKRCYNVCLQKNDIIFQAKVLYELFDNLYHQERHAEAIESCLLLFVLKTDLEDNLKESLPYFTAILPQSGSEKEIHVKLTDAYRHLLLYDDALKHNEIFQKLLQSESDTKFSLADLRQLHLVSGNLHHLMGHYETALMKFNEWSKLLKEFQTSNADMEKERLTDLMTSYEMSGKLLDEMSQHNEAMVAWEALQQISKSLQNEEKELDSILLQISTCIKTKQPVKKLQDNLLHSIRHLPVDVSMLYESRCMSLEAEEMVRDGKYSRAIYRQQEAISIGKKCQRMQVQEEEDCDVTLALYIQHSTSEQMLKVGLKILVKTILRIEGKMSVYRDEGVVHYHKDFATLTKCYKALQVILHRMKKYELSACLTETFYRRSTLIARKMKLQFPLQLAQDADIQVDSCVVDLCAVADVLGVDDVTTLYYTVHECGYLAHLVSSHGEHVSSYLLVENVVEVGELMERLKLMVTSCHCDGIPQSGSEKLCNIYNTENRHLPFLSSTSGNSPMVKIEASLSDHRVEMGATAEGLTRNEVMKELFSILIQPFYTYLYKLPENSSLTIIPDSFLNLVPFDELIGATDRNTFGSRFNISTSPNSLVLHNNNKRQKKKEVGDGDQLDCVRKRQLEKIYSKSEVRALEVTGLDKSFGCLVTSATNGTPIITSNQYLASHKQMENNVHACVIGSPTFNRQLQLEDGTEWKLPKSPVAFRQCKNIAEYMDVAPITGNSATKERFLNEMKRSTIIHICTFGCFRKGVLCFAANNYPAGDRIPVENLLISSDELLFASPFNVRLVVLSSCYEWKESGDDIDQLKLVNSLLNAGVQSVVFPRWPIPDNVSDAFYFYLYTQLQNDVPISKAMFESKKEMKRKFSNPHFWNSFVVVGDSDVIVDLSSIRTSQLQGLLSESEAGCLSPPPAVDTGKNSSEIFHSLQTCFSRLSASIDVTKEFDLVDFLIGLLVEATQRLAHDDNCQSSIVMIPQLLLDTDGGEDLIKLVGFDVQSVRDGSHLVNSSSSYMLVFPHWNQDHLLLPLHQALTGFHELCSNQNCILSLSRMLPLDQDQLCNLIDLLAIVKHTPTIQLGILDPSIKPIWFHNSIRSFLLSIGFLTIRSLLIFRRSLSNRQLLIGSLQLLISFCLHRDHKILESLDISTLGEEPKLATLEPKSKLESLQPLLMPRQEILVRSSWMKDTSYKREWEERKKLASEIAQVTSNYNRILDHAKWWHRDVKVPRASAMTEPGSETSNKVKVLSGATPSCDRTPVNGEDSLQESLHQTLKMRHEAHLVLQKRCEEITRRQMSAIRGCYLPFSGDKQ